MSRVLSFIFILAIHTAFSQKINAEYRIIDIRKITKSPEKVFNDSVEFTKYLSSIRRLAWKENYIEFSVDSVVGSQGNYLVFGNVGEKYEHVSLTVDQKEMDFLGRRLSSRKNGVSIDKLDPDKIHKRIEEINNHYIDNGYPFCSIQIERLGITNMNFEGSLSIERGPLVSWSKIMVKGDSSLNARFISSLINIKVGDHYSEVLFSKISEIIQNTPYLSEISPAEVLFTKEGAELYLYLQNVPRSSINGIIGFQPDPVSGKLNFTGDVRLKLLNVLKHGEKLNLNWQSVAKQTQSLNSSVAYPYLFNSPFGINAAFNLYKRDTSFLETEGNLGLGYNLSPSWNIQVYYSRSSSNLLSGTFSANDQRGTVKTNSYGIASEKLKVDYLPNPSRGYYFNIKAQGGIRNYQRNDTIPVEKDQTLKTDLYMGCYLPIRPRHIIHLANQTAYYYAEEIFSNELYRFGGLLEQRGFNEDELLGSARSTFTFEYRFLLDKNSNVFAFFDLSWYERKTSSYLRDIPYGTGLGLSFSSNIGVFNLAYAIGQQMNNGFQLSNSKIHFGYSALF